MEVHKPEEDLFLGNLPVQERKDLPVYKRHFQMLLNIKLFVFFYAIAGCLFAASSSYFNGIVTTLEKHFKIPSRNIGIIMSASDIVNVFGSWFISYYGGKQHRPRWMAIGLILLAVYNSLIILPHIIYGSGNLNDISALNENTMTCRVGGMSNCITEEESEYTPQIIFFIAHFIYGFGDTIYWILAPTFVDDNAPKALAPLFMSISAFGRFLGPSLGFSLASVCLKYFISPNYPPPIEHTDPRWIGAWWIGETALILAIIVPALVIACFPRNITKQNKKTIRPPQTMKSTLQKLFKNKIVVLLSISSIFHSFAFGPFWIFTPKYIEIQFKQSAETSNMVVGSLGIVSLAFGIMFSGGIMSYFKPKAVTIMKTNISLGIISILLVICYSMLGCEEAIKSLKVGDFDCNMNCDCDYVPYSPMCGADEKTYVSPCHAGCTDSQFENGKWSYTNCSCVPDGIKSGSCPVDCERSFKIYIVVLCLFKFLIAAGRGFIGLIFMRAVDERDKSAAMGFFVSTAALFSFIPIPIFYGWLYDTFCLVWGSTCSSKGNCWLYDAEGLRFYLCAVSLFGYVIGLVLDCVATKYSKNIKCFDEH